MEYLTLAEIIVLHARLIQRTGGSEGILNLGLLEAAVARPQATFDNKELYPTLWDKASALMESIIQNHPFVDGNKRVALTTAGLFLERNGYTLTASNQQAFAFTMETAQGRVTREAIATWLKKHSTPN